MNHIDQKITTLAQLLLRQHTHLVVAESCTGGLIAATCTEPSGASSWFDRGFVTYSNQAKMEMLGVSSTTPAQYGAVSEETAREMAHGSIKNAAATTSIATTGIAGPDGGSLDKPVGLIWFGFEVEGKISTNSRIFSGNRHDIRQQAAQFAIEQLIGLLTGSYDASPCDQPKK